MNATSSGGWQGSNKQI